MRLRAKSVAYMAYEHKLHVEPHRLVVERRPELSQLNVIERVCNGVMKSPYLG
jgi:hypothetical protein